MKTSRYIVYALVDPRDGQVRYVGKSATGMKRPNEYRYLCGAEKTYKANWIRQLLMLGLDYEVVVLERLATKDQLPFAEKKWIAALRFAGARLTNMTDGGDGQCGLKHSAEAIAKISAANATRVWSTESRQRLSESKRGNKCGADRIITEEARHNISKAALKRFQNGIHPAKGVKRSAETKAKMAEARRRWWANRRAAGTGGEY